MATEMPPVREESRDACTPVRRKQSIDMDKEETMKRSTDRILITHAGNLPRPEGLLEMVTAKSRGQAVDAEDLNRRLRRDIAEVVQQQIASGIDIVNDGEISKTSFTDYVRD